MNQLVSATFARNNFSDLLDRVVAEKETVILLRKSRPQAAIIPYEEIEAKEKNWQKEFDQAVKETRPYFLSWLKKQKINPKKLTETKLYELLDRAAGRN